MNCDMINRMSDYQLQQISFGMSEMAAKHKDDLISNHLARVADMLVSKGFKNKLKLNDIDMKFIEYYMKRQK